MRTRSAEHENLIYYVRRCFLTSSAKRVTLGGVDKEDCKGEKAVSTERRDPNTSKLGVSLDFGTNYTAALVSAACSPLWMCPIKHLPKQLRMMMR